MSSMPIAMWCCASQTGCGKNWCAAPSCKRAQSRKKGVRPLFSALVVQARLLARKPGSQVLDILLRELSREAFHHRVGAAADLVVGEGAHQVVVVLPGKDRLVGGRGLVAVGPVARGAHLRRLGLAASRIARGVQRERQRGGKRQNGQGSPHFCHLPPP